MSPNVDQHEREATEEQASVRRWRRAQFMSLGFSLRDAQRLTFEPVDLGEMRKLISAGCPHETAQRILL
jgi:hypothetical protein